MANTKIAKTAETKKESAGPAKKEYRISQTENGRTHQIVYTIYQKVIWTSELGKREEWVTVREWKIGIKTGWVVKEIIESIEAASRGETLPEHKEHKTTSPYYPDDHEDESP